MATLARQNRNDVYESLQPELSGMRLYVFELLVAAGDKGLARHEIVDASIRANAKDKSKRTLKLSTVCGRVNDLEKLGLIEETGERRATDSGKTAVVIRAKVTRPGYLF